MLRVFPSLPLALVGVLLGASLTMAQDATGDPPDANSVVDSLGFSLRNPNEISEQWRLDGQERDVAFGPSKRSGHFEEWRQKMNENGLLLTVSATHLMQFASDSAGTEDSASGFELLVDGTWTPVGFGTDSPLTFGFELVSYHRLGTELPPVALGGTIGSLWPTAVAFDDTGPLIGQFWVQKKFNAEIGFRIGRLFAITAYDYFPLKNFRTDFLDGINSANLVIPLPGSRGFGGFGVYRPAPNVYIRAGFHDANADNKELGFETFNGETFKILEFGFDPGLAERQKGAPPPGDIHVSFWQQDERKDAGIDDGWGAGFSASQRFGDYLPFFRAGVSRGGDNGPALLKTSVNFGVAIDNIAPNNSDRFGVSFSWGDPTAPAFATRRLSTSSTGTS